MAKYFLLNNVTVRTNSLYAGSAIDSAVDDVPTILAAGGRLWSASDLSVAAAAASATEAKKRGADVSKLESIMTTAVLAASGVLTTTDATPAFIPGTEVLVPSLSGLLVEAAVHAEKTDGTAVYGKTSVSELRTPAAPPTVIDEEVVVAEAGAMTATVVWALNAAGNPQLQATGVAATNIRWRARIRATGA